MNYQRKNEWINERKKKNNFKRVWIFKERKNEWKKKGIKKKKSCGFEYSKNERKS